MSNPAEYTLRFFFALGRRLPVARQRRRVPGLRAGAVRRARPVPAAAVGEDPGAVPAAGRVARRLAQPGRPGGPKPVAEDRVGPRQWGGAPPSGGDTGRAGGPVRGHRL